MLVFLLTLAGIAIVMAAMAIGVAITGRRMKGSCGGVAGSCECERAGIPVDQRTCGKQR